MRIDNINSACEIKGIVKGLKSAGKFCDSSGYYTIETTEDSLRKIASDPELKLHGAIDYYMQQGWLTVYGAKIHVDKRAELDRFIGLLSSRPTVSVATATTSIKQPVMFLTDGNLLKNLVEQFRSEDSKN